MNMSFKKFLKENSFFIVSVLVITLLFYIKLPYYVNAPGGIININNRIVYEDKKEFNGSLNMLYVKEYEASIPTYLMSYILSDWDLESINESRISNETTSEIEYRNKIMLENSSNNAKLVAYKEAGKEIEVLSKKTVVIGTILDNGLKIGDEILEVENQKVEDVNTIKNIIVKASVGDTLNFKIKRNSKEKSIDVLIREQDNDKVIGVVIVTNYEYKTTPELKLKFKKSESGASGGMMMALSIYCALSDKDLIKGRNIAGTGTIDEDGTVGEIDGIKYKVIGAYRNGMDVILVPSDNYKEAIQVVKKKKYDIEIVEVKTLRDAINYLEKTK